MERQDSTWGGGELFPKCERHRALDRHLFGHALSRPSSSVLSRATQGPSTSAALQRLATGSGYCNESFTSAFPSTPGRGPAVAERRAMKITLYRNVVAAALAAFLSIGAFVPAAAGVHHHKTKATAPVSSGSLQMFSSEGAAQAHCPRETVVWLNTNSGIYHEKGMRWYGNTREGAYVCRSEANAAGDRDTRNGQ